MTVSAASALNDPGRRFFPQALDRGAIFNPALPPVRAPFALSTAEPPRGKVLVIEDDAVMALALQRMLREAGFRTVGPATSVADMQRLVSRGAIDCAVLDVEVDRRAPLPIADTLAFWDVPFVWLAEKSGPMPLPHRRRPVVAKPVNGAILAKAIEEAMSCRSRLDAGSDREVGWPRVYPSL